MAMYEKNRVGRLLHKRQRAFWQRIRFKKKTYEIQLFGNGLAGGQIVSTVMWQQKVSDCLKKL